MSYLEKYSHYSRNRFFNSLDTLVVRAKLLGEPYHREHLGLPRGGRVPALLVHTAITIGQLFFVAQGLVNLGLSLFTPSKSPSTFVGLAMDVASLFVKVATVAVATLAIFTRSLATLFNYHTEEEHAFLGECNDDECSDKILEDLVDNFRGVELEPSPFF